MHHEQDIRNMGGLKDKIPFTYVTMVIGTLALTGFPLTAGYFSKDAIIESAFVAHNPFALYAFLATVIAAGLTSFYSWRLIFKTFHGEPHDRHHYEAAHESPLTMLIPLGVLSAGSILAGFPFKEVFAGHGIGEFFRESLKMNPTVIDEMHHIATAVALSPTVMMVWAFWCRGCSISGGLSAGRARASIRCSTSSCSTSGTSTSCTTDLRAAAKWLAASSGRRAMASSSTASGLTASRPACST